MKSIDAGEGSYLESVIEVLFPENKPKIFLQHGRVELAAEDGVYSLVSLLVETFHLEGRNRTVEGRKEGGEEKRK